MTGWHELVSAALLGTQRRSFDPAGLPATVRPLVTGEPATALLTAAAALTTYRRAGYVPLRPGRRLPEAERDERPLVPRVARKRLRLLPPELLGEWLQAVRAAGLRVPPEHLPALAETARSRPELRASLAAVAGPAGSWLGERNPAWLFLVSAVPDATGDEAWEHGNLLQRREWLDRTLEDDPAMARTALVAAWASEPASHRAEFLEVLGEHLAPDDEPFLESALDDRAAQVRESSARLLARLPGSHLAARMRERAARLVQRQRTPGGDVLEVALPDASDPVLLRDNGGAQARSSLHPMDLLCAIVAATPLAHWAQYGTPAEVLALPVIGCDPRPLRAGWATAAERQRDAGWAAAVLAGYGPESIDGAVVALTRLLPAQQQRGAVAVLAGKLGPQALATAVSLLPMPWSAELGTALLDWLAAHPGNRGLTAAARTVGRRVPLACLRHPIATAPVPPGADPWWRELGATLTVRREMHEELLP